MDGVSVPAMDPVNKPSSSPVDGVSVPAMDPRNEPVAQWQGMPLAHDVLNNVRE
jgi:hypothetical protein